MIFYDFLTHHFKKSKKSFFKYEKNVKYVLSNTGCLHQLWDK